MACKTLRSVMSCKEMLLQCKVGDMELCSPHNACCTESLGRGAIDGDVESTRQLSTKQTTDLGSVCCISGGILVMLL